MPSTTDEELRRDPHLVQLGLQLGPLAVEHRIAAARAKEAIVLAFLDACYGGLNAIEARRAIAELAPPVNVAFLAKRYEREGLLGLVDRRLKLRSVTAPEPVRRETSGPRRGARAHSFLRWVGSKKRALPVLLARLPPVFGTYYEPMLGSGALFLELRPERAVLGDVNEELVHAWRVVQQHPAELLTSLRGRENSSADYHAQRALDPAKLGPVERAARFVFLNQTGFNGLYRVNKQGLYNVPYGQRDSVQLADEVVIGRVHEALRGATLRAGPYREVCRDATAGDLVYFDPPYHADYEHDRVRYDASAFSHADQAALADFARELDRRGCFVLVSHADSPFIRGLWHGFHLETHAVRRSVGGAGAHRGHAAELLLRNYPKLPEGVG